MSLPPFEDVVAEHGAVVLRVCRSLLDAVDADDAWSETFLAALRAYPELPPDSNVRGWLVTIAHHKSIDVLRRAARASRVAAVVTELAAPPEPEPLDAGVRARLRALPPKQQGAVVYRYLADLSYGEVARLLRSSVPAARRSAADGLARLRSELTEGPTP